MSTERGGSLSALQTFVRVDVEIPVENDEFSRGWLTGLIDGEGCIHVRYRSDRNTMYPRLRIYVTSKPIIDEAARIMGVNPFPRGDHGKQVGWYATVSHRKALRVLRVVAPLLLDPSKRCRARRILETFRDVGTIHIRSTAAEFFRDCPPPTRIRNPPRRIISST